MKKYFSAGVGMVFLALVGCTKEDALVIEMRENLLINKKWQLTGMTVRTANGLVSRDYDSLPSYRKDDYFLFKHDSTYEFNDNIDTMPGKHSRILDAGIWQLNSSQTHLEMKSNVFNTTYTPARIVELSASKLSLERTHPGDGSVTTTSYKPI
jgi:hypothetical protein